MKPLTLILLCLLCLTGPVLAQTDSTQIARLIGKISVDNIQTDIEQLADAGGHQTRASYTGGNRWSVDYIKQRFESFPGLTSVALDTFRLSIAAPPFNNFSLFNVVATLAGTDPAQYYIIGGHLDATANLDPSLDWNADWPSAQAPGADDNASGVAATIEIARILSDPANGFTPQATIKFIAFGAEERHPIYNDQNHQGARHYVQNAYQRGDDILGVYVMDMIGYNNTANHYFSIAADSRSTPLGEALLQANDRYQIGLHSAGMPFDDPTYSDHDQFWLYRYKAVLLIENTPPWNDNPPWYQANPYYHRQSDTAETINFEQVAKIAQVTLASVAEQSGVVTSVPEQPVTPPTSFALLQNYPNPFNASTRILYQLLFGGTVRLEIYNLQGQLVRTLVNGTQTPGEYEAVWDGTDETGGFAPSGIYLYELQVEDKSLARSMLFVK